MIEIRVQPGDFDPAIELARLEALGGGAVASFVGQVRGDGGLTELFLDHYPAMTDRMLRALADEAAGRWSLLGVVLIHRIGALGAGERIVLVATASAHRAATLESCAFLIDRLKTDAPFWKRERFGDRSHWVDAREADHVAADRWRRPD